MRVAVICDIHGNLTALEAVLEEVRRERVDHIVIAGDVLPGPEARAALERLRALEVPASFIEGNGDREVLTRMRGSDPETLPPAVRETLRWNAAQLGPRFEPVLASWPSTCRLTIDGVGDVLFCHATPRNDMDIFTRLTPEADVLPAFAGVDAGVVVCGHTHMPFDRQLGPFRVINAGSVGMSFAGPGAFWLRLGPGVELRRTEYNTALAADRMRATGYPGVEEFVSRYIVTSPSEQDMLALFAGVAMK
jgi:predicted phosphodiesterase